ncbi:MAG: HAD-IA family hydrolase [Clostridia bacterium]
MKHIIFDLSEVIIAGQWGIEKKIASRVAQDEKYIDTALMNEDFFDLLRGKITEKKYSENVIRQENWNISVDFLEKITRNNFHNEIAGTREVLKKLKNKNHALYVLSDHAKEWMEYIYKVHDFFPIFNKTYFSYELGCLKSEGTPFKLVLEDLQISPQDALFIDDNPNNIEKAKKFGIEGIVFKNANQLEGELLKRNLL